MNDRIRREVRAELERRGLSVTEVAQQLGMLPNNLSRLLSGSGSQRGQIPPGWLALLEHLGYEVVIQKKED